MIWKTLIVTFLVVGTLAEYQVSDEHRQAFKQVLTQMCKKSGAEDKVDEVEASVKTFVDCVKGLFDVEAIKREIEEAKPNGALDEVFKKYCAKSPQLKTCIHTLIDGATPCVEEKLREQVTQANNATDQLLDFICYKDGDRIALFIAEGGPECFTEKRDQLQACGQKLRDSVSTVEAVKALTLAEKCAKFDELSTCVVRALEACSTPTPGNMAESLLRYVKNGSPCANVNN